jgi:ABC-type branched-subunit amino acid transport system substrate-binding protein
LGSVPGAPQGLTAGGAAGLPAPAGSRVAILAPMTGPYAGVATELVNAAKLGLGATSASGIDVLDTGGTPGGAAAAAQKAIADGAGVIIGPLTNVEASAVGGVTGPAHVDVLALTSDSSVGRPGLWALGITPAEQVQALVKAANGQGHNQIAALLPENPLGDAMGRAVQSAGGAQVQTYASGSFSSMNTALRSLSDYSSRRGPIDAQIKSLRGSHTVAGRREAAKLARQPIPPPPFNALLVAETGGGLGELASLMPYYDVNPGPVLVLGPGLWAANPDAVRAAGFNGSLYAAPDPAAATSFQSSYASAYGASPSALAAIAFDAGAIARVTTQNGHIDQAALTNPSGFSGADGLMALAPDGSVKRGLAVFQVSAGGSQIVQPAPTSFASGT